MLALYFHLGGQGWPGLERQGPSWGAAEFNIQGSLSFDPYRDPDVLVRLKNSSTFSQKVKRGLLTQGLGKNYPHTVRQQECGQGGKIS